MRRNLFVRLLGLVLTVAVFSIAATAWLTTRGTSERLRGEFARTLEADSFVYQELLSYAQSNDSWDAVDTLLAQLAERTGRRIALAGPDGDLLADSAAPAGQDSPPLPSTPTAEVDAQAPLAMIGGTLSAGTMVADAMPPEAVPPDGVPPDAASPDEKPPPDGAGAPDGSTMAGGAGNVVVDFSKSAATPAWSLLPAGVARLTATEAATRADLAQDATLCVQRVENSMEIFVSPNGEVYLTSPGANAKPSPTPTDVPTPTDTPSSTGPADSTGPVDSTAPATLGSPWQVATSAEIRDCVPAELSQPSEATIEVSDTVVKFATTCLDGAGLPYKVARNQAGLPSLIEPRLDDPDGLARWHDCLIDAQAQAVDPFMADPAVLYIGSTDRFDPFSGDGLVRTALTGLAVLAAATGVTVLAGRRLTHPIRTLTAAAQRMGSGDRGARVPVKGHDEVARLGHAFNAMAESIEANEGQRKLMVSDIAHELRTPLANVRGYLEAAEDGVVPLDPALVTSLLEESALLQRLIDDLQDLALADAGMLRIHREPTDAADLARQVVAAHRGAAEKDGITLAGLVPDSVEVDADPTRLRQALGNLVANAVQYTPRGGRVEVRVTRDGDDVILRVTDDGPGIAESHLPHLFDRFYRTETSRNRATGGSGLGLAITKHLVEAHHGTVDVTSTEGVGSTFTIRLPVRAPVTTG